MDTQQTELLPNDLVSIDDAVTITGYAKKTIYGFTYSKAIPYIRKRGRIFFSKSKLETWVKDNTTVFEPA